MKKLLFMSLLLITQTTKTMQLPSGNGQEVEIKFKDHILMPDGTHMRMVYEPLRKQMGICVFNSDFSVNRFIGYPFKLITKANVEKSIEIERICGIASYKHYVLFAAIGTMHNERDTMILGRKSNLDNSYAHCWSDPQADLSFSDISNIVFAKKILFMKGVVLDKKLEQHRGADIRFQENYKEMFPDLE